MFDSGNWAWEHKNKDTVTILAHCVPLPAPGPPKTKTTCLRHRFQVHAVRAPQLSVHNARPAARARGRALAHARHPACIHSLSDIRASALNPHPQPHLHPSSLHYRPLRTPRARLHTVPPGPRRALESAVAAARRARAAARRIWTSRDTRCAV